MVVAPTELHSSIREALIAIAPAFSWTYDVKERTDKFSPNANQSLLLAMLAEHVESKLTIAQNVASVFLTTCFPEHFVPARYLLLLIAGERSSLRESIITSLYGVTRTDHINYSYISSIDHAEAAAQYQDPDKNKLSPEQRRVVLPSFKEMVNYVNEQMEKRATNSSQKHIYGKVTLSCQYETYTEVCQCNTFLIRANSTNFFLSFFQTKQKKRFSIIYDYVCGFRLVQKQLLAMKNQFKKSTITFATN